MYLGVDIGGSHSRWAWLPAGARPGGRAAGVQPAVRGIEAAAAGLLAVLQQAGAASATAVVVAMAGAGDAKVAQALQERLRAAGLGMPVAVVGDTLAAAAGTLADRSGVLLWSGTGSFALARTMAGELVRVGGRGFLLGDQGSGYDLVRRAAAAAVLAADGLAPPTGLAAALVRAFDAPSVERLGAVLQQRDTGAVAAQLPVVLEVASAGDAAAQEVLAEGMAALAMLAAAAARTAGIELRGLPVVLGGGVLAAVPALREELQERLRQLGAGACELAADDAATLGAARLAQALHRRQEPLCGWIERRVV